MLLGPLAIAPELRGLGYGKALMWHAMAQSRMLGHSRIILVGDPEYYNQFGFRRDLALNIQLPGWVEDRRFLALELVAGSMIGVHGMIGKWQPKALPRKKRANSLLERATPWRSSERGSAAMTERLSALQNERHGVAAPARLAHHDARRGRAPRWLAVSCFHTRPAMFL